MIAFLGSVDKLRAKSGKTMVATCGCRGKASFDEAVAACERQRAKLLRTRFCLICPKGTPLERRKGPVRKEAFLLTSGYSRIVCFFKGVHEIAALSLVTFGAPKVTRPSGHERNNDLI